MSDWGDSPDSGAEGSEPNDRRWAIAGLMLAIALVGVVGLVLFSGPEVFDAPDPLKLIQLPDKHTKTDPSILPLAPTEYLGARACAECHKARFDTFCQTAHHLTSAAATPKSIRGSFRQGKNVLKTSNPNLVFEMTARDGAFFQTATVRYDQRRYRHTERFDVVTGSGKIGQTYLFFRGTELFQLPVSFVAELDCWINSPGYKDGIARFSRHVTTQCMQCHATFYDPSVDLTDRGTAAHLILGISCERCHGPGKKHVEYHRQRPSEKLAKFITHPGQLSGQRQMDICSQCHSGGGKMMNHQPPFSFRPGERLDDFLAFGAPNEQKRGGVHTTNQRARLEKSRCYQESASMTCTSCHNPHVLERGNTLLFSQRCQKCHDADHGCGMSDKLGERIATNCIDCHMPMSRDEGTQLHRADGSSFWPKLRDHEIGVYPELSREIEARLFSEKASPSR